MVMLCFSISFRHPVVLSMDSHSLMLPHLSSMYRLNQLVK
ncbi:hypothetical protein AB205_0078790 [Aquarana catesbeiana]|uniref:Uncharacterized protein n=1 Tax=Aquarana catesbeiana TaxID=8400 RepID=A0A2G9RTY6_AQUCT|nr:hypothetical protein AB205_0078790 [Aquarana catesbeiana]